MNGTGIFLCNFSGMIKNVLPSLRQRAGPQRICSRQKASAAALPVTPSRKPRMCGEKSGLPVSVPTRMGSPPRMRGKVIVDLVLTERHRITPACAGKSSPRGAATAGAPDHPRTCGEKGLSTFWSRNHSGSPPHMRGKVVVEVADKLMTGITPAYAGKRGFQSSLPACPRDHPRMCGEKS